MKKIISFLLGFCMLLTLVGCGADKPTTENTGEYIGTVSIVLDKESAPLTVENFISLAKNGFYDGLSFHRIMDGFMMQGGDPKGDGTGGSDKEIKGEFSENGVNNNLSHERGVVSMARANDPDSASSQFFIVHKDSKFLDGKYAAFGYVSEGMSIVDRICENAVNTDNNGSVPKDKRPIIKSVTIREAEISGITYADIVIDYSAVMK